MSWFIAMTAICPLSERRSPLLNEGIPQINKSIMERKIQIKLREGMHARPCSLICDLARQIGGEFRIRAKGMEVNACNVLEMLMLASPSKSYITVSINGLDDSVALKAIDAIEEMLGCLELTDESLFKFRSAFH